MTMSFSEFQDAPLFIGMPVYNGDKFLKDALNSLLAQRYQDWRLLISDNCSTDSTPEIALRYAMLDTRIKYHKHATNIGAIGNFLFLANQAKAPYFMWMACDDVCEEHFLETCLSRLENDKHLGMAFANVCNIDSYGRVIRNYPDLPILAGKPSIRTIARFLVSTEIMGKANLIYSVYRTSVCKSAIKVFPFSDAWGSDIIFNLVAISKAGIFIDPEVRMFKRVVGPSDEFDRVQPVNVSQQIEDQTCPPDLFESYAKETIAAMRGTRFFPLVSGIMRYRLWEIRKIYDIKKGVRRGWKVWKVELAEIKFVIERNVRRIWDASKFEWAEIKHVFFSN